jgi:glutathione S-transferase
MRRAMTVTASETERSLRQAGAGLDRIEAELGDGEYLAGDGFSVADLTAASLYFPLVRPPEYQYDYPSRWSERLEELRASVADRPAFGWITEMWRRHRGGSAEVPR